MNKDVFLDMRENLILLTYRGSMNKQLLEMKYS